MVRNPPGEITRALNSTKINVQGFGFFPKILKSVLQDQNSRGELLVTTFQSVKKKRKKNSLPFIIALNRRRIVVKKPHICFHVRTTK